MNVPIPTTVDKFFRQRLELLKIFNPYNKLRDRELDVLAAIQKEYYLNKDLELHQIHPIVFSYDTMLKIRENLKISEAVLNNNKMNLRKAGFMTNRQLFNKYLADPDKLNDCQMDFQFFIAEPVVVSNE